MASTLTGAIVVIDGTTLTEVESITVGGLELNDINYAANDDTNAVTNHIPGTVTEGPMTATVAYNFTMQSTLRTKALARATGTMTFTDGASSAYHWEGLGYVSSVSGVDSDPDSEDTFTVTVIPSDKWTYGSA